jgi:hypothetical protein
MRCAGSVLSREPCFRDAEPGSDFCVRHEPPRRMAGGRVGSFELIPLAVAAVVLFLIIAGIARVVVWAVTGL